MHDTLKAEPLVLNYDGVLWKPTDVVLVPREYRTDGEDGRVPLLLCTTTSWYYLSDLYDESCWVALKSLGVREMATGDFVQDFINMVTEEPQVFRSKTSQWHSILSWKLTSSLSSEDARAIYRSRIRKLALVPLSGDHWVTSEEPGVFLPSHDGFDLRIQGVGLRLVIPEVAADNGRASLLRFLGIKTISNVEICDYIALLHGGGRTAMSTSTTADLVSQIIFLLSFGWQNHDQQDLWFMNEEDTLCPASTLYLQSSDTYAASHYLALLGHASARFLHPDYAASSEQLPGGNKAFVKWLIVNMRLSKFIRVFDVRPTLSVEHAIKLSRDFLNVVQHDLAPSWIFMLRDNWRYSWLDIDSCEDLPMVTTLNLPWLQLRQRHQTLVDEIGTITVRCLDGTRSPLKSTYLLLPKLLEDSVDGITLMQVKDSDNAYWKHLKCLGLGVEPDLMFYMRCLEKLSASFRNGTADPQPSRKAATYLDQIQARYNENAEFVK